MRTFRFSPRRWLRLNAFLQFLAYLSTSLAVNAQAQATHAPPQNPWTFSLAVDGYIVPDDVSYPNPTFTADRSWLHLEGRYNYESLHTGSLWVGYNFSSGKNLTLNLTPMVGGVFGSTAGVAPGCEFSLAYKKFELSFSNEYVFAFSNRSDSFYYAWPQFTYSPLEWLRLGGAAQRTRAYQTELDVQRGFLVGVAHKGTSFTTYVFNPDASPTVVLEASIEF